MKALHTISKLLFFLLALLPLGLGWLFASFYASGLIGYGQEEFTMTHWHSVFGDPQFYFSMLTSIMIAVVTVIISYFIALSVIHTIATNYISRLPAIFYLPMLLPPIISSFLAYFLLNDAGLLARIFHWPVGSLTLVQDTYQLGIFIALIWLTTPYFILLMYQTYRQHELDKYIHQAKQLGASVQYIKANIIWPLLWNNLKRNVLLSTIMLTTVYELPLIIGNLKYPMISVMISRKFQKFNLADLPQAYAMTAIVSAIIMIVVFIITHQSKNKQSHVE